MTPATPATATRIDAPPDLHRIRHDCDRLLATVAACDLEDHRWLQAGPLVARSATRLRAALGLPTLVMGVAPPIVRVRDLATAARGVLGRDANVVDHGSAAEFMALAWEIERVLGGHESSAAPQPVDDAVWR